jgi:hypothetical protein
MRCLLFGFLFLTVTPQAERDILEKRVRNQQADLDSALVRQGLVHKDTEKCEAALLRSQEVVC